MTRHAHRLFSLLVSSALLGVPATAAAQDAPSMTASDADALIAQARRAEVAGDRARAAAAYAALHERAPDHPEAASALWRAALLHDRLGDTERAATLYLRVYDTSPAATTWTELDAVGLRPERRAVAALRRGAELLAELGRHDAVAPRYETLATLDPSRTTTADDLWTAFRAYEASANPEGARRVLYTLGLLPSDTSDHARELLRAYSRYPSVLHARYTLEGALDHVRQLHLDLGGTWDAEGTRLAGQTAHSVLELAQDAWSRNPPQRTFWEPRAYSDARRKGLRHVVGHAKTLRTYDRDEWFFYYYLREAQGRERIAQELRALPNPYDPWHHAHADFEKERRARIRDNMADAQRRYAAIHRLVQDPKAHHLRNRWTHMAHVRLHLLQPSTTPAPPADPPPPEAAPPAPQDELIDTDYLVEVLTVPHDLRRKR